VSLHLVPPRFSLKYHLVVEIEWKVENAGKLFVIFRRKTFSYFFPEFILKKMNPLPFVIECHLQCYGHVRVIIEINDRSTNNKYLFLFFLSDSFECEAKQCAGI
jgi:hypothetical protein